MPRTICRIEVSDGSFLFSFFTLFHLSLILLLPEFPLNIASTITHDQGSLNEDGLFLKKKTIPSVILDLKQRCLCKFILYFQDKHLMHDHVRQINMRSSNFLFKNRCQKLKKVQSSTWLFYDKLIHLHEKLFFSIKFKINLSGTIRNICIHRYTVPKMS